MDLASGLSVDDHLLLLVSGGGSALLPAPADGMTLADKQALNEALLASGLDIHDMNVVRRLFSKLKGGRLARIAAPAAVTQFLLSDVPGDRLESIASGPAETLEFREDELSVNEVIESAFFHFPDFAFCLRPADHPFVSHEPDSDLSLNGRIDH